MCVRISMEKPSSSKKRDHVEEEEEDEDVSFSSSDFELSDDDEDKEKQQDKGKGGKVVDPEDHEEVQTSFEFFDPSEGDFLGMKGLLNAYLDGTVYDCSGLVDHVIRQKTVGSVVRLEEQLDPIAVVSVVNLKTHEHMQCLKDILTFIRENAPTEEDKHKLDSMVLCEKQKHSHGLVVSDRVVNCPLELSSPLQQAIFDEIEWATEDEPTKDLRESFMFTHFLLFTRVYYSNNNNDNNSNSKGKKKKQKTMSTNSSVGGWPSNEMIFVRPEDEFFMKECEWSFTFPNKQAGHNDMEGMRQHRLVMWINKKGIKNARKQLDQIFGNFLPQQDDM